MDTDEKKVATKATLGHDEIDFSSGFETQYRKEYSPLKPIYIPPPDERNAWFRSATTIVMVLFLGTIFLVGTVLLVVEVVTASATQVLLIVAAYVVVASGLIWLSTLSGSLR